MLMRTPSRITIGLVIAAAIVSMILNIVSKRHYESRMSDVSETIQNVQVSFAEHVYVNAKVLKLKDQQFSDGSQDSVRLGSIFSDNEAKLVLRLKENQCMDCIDSILQKITTFSGYIGTERIVIISSYTNTSEIRRLLKVRGLPYKLYNRASNLFDKSIEDIPPLRSLGKCWYIRYLPIRVANCCSVRWYRVSISICRMW